MKIAIATDHNGVEVKEEIKKILNNKNYEVLDLSENNTLGDDYPLYAFDVAKSVVIGSADLGILLCGTGIGMSIAANKVKGIRCAHVSSISEAKLARQHNNANIIALSAKNNLDDIIKMIDIFITTDFGFEDRHIRRIKQISDFEELNSK